jgi:NADP-dependent 3-hydroxy acid dehydrogenase YdfG
MVHTLRNKVVVIPHAVTPAGAAVAKLVQAQHGGLALGASGQAQFKALDAEIDGRQGAYAQRVDLDSPKSVAQFFNVAFAQFGRLDVIVVEAIPLPTPRASTAQMIDSGVRRLLHCLDAALEYAKGDLHVISIAPIVGRIAIPVATAFLGSKLATTKMHSVPRLRMSIVSPFAGQHPDDASLARTVVNVMRESRSPDVTEIVLPSRRGDAHHSDAKRHNHTRSKACLPL